MEFRILGPLEIVDAGEMPALGSAQQQAVLALLVLHAPRPVSPRRRSTLDLASLARSRPLAYG